MKITLNEKTYECNMLKISKEDFIDKFKFDFEWFETNYINQKINGENYYSKKYIWINWLYVYTFWKNFKSGFQNTFWENGNWTKWAYGEFISYGDYASLYEFKDETEAIDFYNKWWDFIKISL